MIDAATKDRFITELEKIPLIAAACRTAGIGRATIYRWQKDDKEFAERVTAAIELGRGDVNDLAESKLIQAIKRGDAWALRYWLEANNKRFYKPRKAIEAPRQNRQIQRIQFEVVDKREPRVYDPDN
jgi:hypothetical protein